MTVAEIELAPTTLALPPFAESVGIEGSRPETWADVESTLRAVAPADEVAPVGIRLD